MSWSAGWRGGADAVRAVAFSSDGGLLATGSADKTIKLWDSTTGQVKATLEGHVDGVTGVAFAPDGRSLASGGDDSTVRLWDAATGAEWFRLQGHGSMVSAVSFAPDGRTLASGHEDGTILLRATRDLPGPPPPQASVAGARLLWSNLASLDAREAFQTMRTLRAHPKTALSLLSRLRGGVPVVSPQTVRELIASLDATSFRKREWATRELADLGRQEHGRRRPP